MEHTLKIQNLKCGGCAHTIQTKLSELKGIYNIVVMVESDEVLFNSDSKNAIIEVKQTLKAIGYPEESEINNIVTKAKSFVSCATGKFSNHE